ncbi:BFA1 (YJR053W) [Zygosaccharomyces parabailii]|uniref:BN860_15324g1_1 n=1 Tax=Zygosaccharomyces bailii (strain CLIB 213 / ATCC 58445 / CBS 680 / BCRC 21525 / NBRC 1098 / NCYC 1416 / NRRL Y-2227) TaxID=1333698 RepID=A0A8J2T5L2_ZYGB2|nr:BFA1 (YJR053W) [Zygosaccharomyces parabailii]CDF88655.1 BN860_15324g1_1 [Zygosaccharomyces bailii CLIB 213]CDH14469.1 related to Mitotic check point protein BFA1 [Zygosaccharomyces bailii ISA1307]
MSIRPVNLEDFPETSFEDMETTFAKGNFNSERAGGSTSPMTHQHVVLPTPTSASSGGTTFSNAKGKRLSVGSSSRTDEEGEEEEEDFLNDFQEFQVKRDDFDDAFKTFFNMKSSDCNNFVEKQLDEKLKLGPTKRTSRLKQQQSMQELKNHQLRSSSSFSRLPNSLSAGDLRIRPNASVRFKKSMPSLSSNFNGMIREEDESEDIPTLKPPHKLLNTFEEAREDDEAEDKDFVFDESLIQPQFLSKASESSPLKLSPSQYDIVRDDTLLTPRLHRRHRDWNSKDQLDSFKEHRKSQGGRKSYSHQRPQTASRIQIIKQEIDQNTPIKNGRMYYNPKTMKWEGNEQVLEKFRKLDSQDEKPLLIRARTSISEPQLQSADWEIEKSTKASKCKPSSNRRVVGKMMFDEENLKWVSVEKDDEIDPFANIEDVAPLPNAPEEETIKLPNGKHLSPFLRSHSQLLPSNASALDRLNSSATTRYHSMGVTKAGNGHSDPQFYLNSKQLERFWHEENKWNRKVGAWFLMGDSDAQPEELTELNEINDTRSFMYEIRNMVLNSTR